jgi:hypothetical protein
MKPEIEHFRLFGCPVYFHVPKEKKSKLDPLERKDTVNLQRHSKSASLGVSLDRRGSGQSDSVGCEPRHCASKDTLSEPDLAHVCKCV